MDGIKQCKHGRNFCCECHMAGDLNPAREALKLENQRIYPIGAPRDYESELAALREELAIVNREKNDVAYRANETAERLNSMTISKATMRNKLKQKLASTQQRLTAAEQRDAALLGLLERWYEANCNDLVHVEDGAYRIVLDTNEALTKPTESGASE